MIILVDHDIEGQAAQLWATFLGVGWMELAALRIVTFSEVDLPRDSADRDVWHFAQEQGMLLLTNNRNADGADSLNQTIQRDATPKSLPVITIGNLRRISERDYRERCVERLVEIVLYPDRYLGTGRIFIP